MRRRGTTRLLIAANVVALAALAAVELSAPAGAQAVRARSTYTAASGGIAGTDNQVVYIVDESTQEAIAVQWDPQSKQLRGLGFRSLAIDSAEITRPRSN